VYDTNGAAMGAIDQTVYPTLEALQQVEFRQILDTMFLVHEDVEPRKLMRLNLFDVDPFACTAGDPDLTVTLNWHNLQDGDLITFRNVEAFGSVASNRFEATFAVHDVTTHTFQVTLTGTPPGGTHAAKGGASVEAWVLAKVKLINIPEYDFADSLSPTAVANDTQRITFVGTFKRTYNELGQTGDPVGNNGNVHKFKLIFGGYETGWIYWAADDAGIPAGSLMVSYIKRALFLLPSLAGGSIANPDNFEVTWGGDDGNGNYYALVEFKGKYAGKQVTPIFVNLAGPTPQPEIIVTEEEDAGEKTEPVWSATRGWPRSVDFHEGRLCFGGSRSLPSQFWASVTGDYGNFDLGDAHDDEACMRDVDVNAADAIEHLVSSRALMVLTRRAEYYQTETPMTPEAITFKRQTTHGSNRVPPCSVGGAVYFSQRNGRGVRRLLYNFQEDSFRAEEVSILARHILNGPVDMAAQQHPLDGDYILVPNSEGTCAVLAVDRDQELAGWTRWQTQQGSYTAVAVVNDTVFFEVKRGSYWYLEKLREDFLLDCATRAVGNVTQVTGLAFLYGIKQERPNTPIRARVDFADGGQFYADANATITQAGDDYVYTFVPEGDNVGRDVASIIVGIGITATLTPLRPNLNVASGSMLLRRKRIARVSLDVHDTEVTPEELGTVLRVALVDQEQYYELGDQLSGAARWKMRGTVSCPLLGWSKSQNVSPGIDGSFELQIQHIGPGTCTIRSIERELEVTGGLGEERDG
jgi:hypothetical protein